MTFFFTLLCSFRNLTNALGIFQLFLAVAAVSPHITVAPAEELAGHGLGRGRGRVGEPGSPTNALLPPTTARGAVGTVAVQSLEEHVQHRNLFD